MSDLSIRFDAATRTFGLLGAPESMRLDLVANYGWEPLPGSPGVFFTPSAAIVAPMYDICDDEAKRAVYPFAINYHNSFCLGPVPHVIGPDGTPTAPRAPVISPEAITFPFQIGGLQVLQSRRHAYIGDQPGAGKSLMALSIFNDQTLYPRNPAPGRSFLKPAHALRVIICCPAFLVEHWIEEAQQWFIGDRLPVVPLDKPRPAMTRAGIFILPDSRADKHLPMLLDSGRFDGLVIDEAHRMKADSTVKRAAAVWGAIGRPGLVDACDRVFPVSGTPIPNNPVEVHSPLMRLSPECTGGMTRNAFELHYTTGGGWGEPVIGRREFGLQCEMRARGFMLRRMKGDFLPQLPQKRIMLLHMPINGSVAELVAEEVKLFELAKLKTHRTAEELAELIGHIMRVRKLLAIAKAPRIAEYIRFQFETNESVTKRLVVFMLHTEAIDIVRYECERHRIRVFVVDGRVPMRQRHEMKREFQRPGGPPTLFLGQTRAAGVGLTLTRARRVALGEVSWSFAENEQAMDRVHRISQTEQVDVDVLTFPHAVESKVIQRAAAKEVMAGRILDERVSSAILAAEEAMQPEIEWDDE